MQRHKGIYEEKKKMTGAWKVQNVQQANCSPFLLGGKGTAREFWIPWTVRTAGELLLIKRIFLITEHDSQCPSSSLFFSRVHLVFQDKK